jgi:hypothetical protein
MRIKRFAAAAITAVLLSTVPATAHADITAGTCEIGVILPKKLVIKSYFTSYSVRLTGETDCVSYATWSLSQGDVSTGSTINFYSPDVAELESYVGRPATVHGQPRSGAYSLHQFLDPVTGANRAFTVIETPSATMAAKYDSRIEWRKATRNGKKITLRAAASSVSDATQVAGTYTGWRRAKVLFQHQQGRRWITVEAAAANSHGVASAKVTFKRGHWRAVTVATGDTWGRSTGSHTL